MIYAFYFYLSVAAIWFLVSLWICCVIEDPFWHWSARLLVAAICAIGWPIGVFHLIRDGI
jgi:hypothetical protein